MSTARTQTKPGPPINRRAWSDPRYLAAQAKVGEIGLRRNEIQQAIEDEHSRIAEQRLSSRRQAAAEALVDGRALEVSIQPSIDLAKLYEDQAIVEAALEIARKRLLDVEMAVSCEIIEAVKPAYLEIIRRQHAAVAELIRILEEEEDFIHHMTDGGTRLCSLQRSAFMSLDDAKHSFRVELVNLPARTFGLKLDDPWAAP